MLSQGSNEIGGQSLLEESLLGALSCGSLVVLKLGFFSVFSFFLSPTFVQDSQ